MKRLALILSLLLAVLASCTRPAQPVPAPEAPQHDTIAAFDTLMQSQPDSALQALLDFNDNHKSLAPFDRHYADLLLSEALFKNDYEQTLRTEVQQAQTYFDSLAAAYPKNDDFALLSARSHYMNGVGLMETDSVVDACAEYLKALEIMEDRFDEKELTDQKAKFMALTYNRLGDLFSDHLMTEQALLCYKQSFHFCETEPISKYEPSNLLVHIGIHFNMLKQPDSAFFYFDMAEQHLPDTLNIIYRDIITSRTILLYEKKMIEKEEALMVMSSIRDLAETEQEKIDRELVISEIFYKGNQIDSAQACLERVFYSDTDLLSKIHAARYLSEIHIEKEEYDKADYYKSFLAPLAVESYEQKNRDSHMIELFKSYQKHTLQNEHNKESASLRRKAFLIFVVFAIVVIPIIIFAQKRKHLRKMNSAKKEFEHEKQQNISLVNEIRTSNTILKEENQKLSESIKAMHTMQKSTFKDYENLMKEPAVRNLLNRITNLDFITTNPYIAYAKHAITPKEKRMLTDVFDKYCPNFSNRLTDLYPDLGKAEVLFCQYMLLGLTIPQIAVLTQKDFSNSYRNERNIKAKMKCKDIHQHLKHLLFDISESN